RPVRLAADRGRCAVRAAHLTRAGRTAVRCRRLRLPLASPERHAMRLAVLAASVLLCVVAPPAQGKRGPAVRPVDFTVDPAAQDPTNLIVKFVEGSGVRWRDGQFVGVPGVNLAEVNALMLRHTTSVSRLFLRSEADLDRERAEVIAKLGPAVLAEIDPPADLHLYYRARTATAEHGMALWRALLALPVVETAFLDTPPGYQADPVVEVDDIPPTTPDYSGQQTYFDAPPSGINLRVARVIPGGRGE